jgi:hypothetical protein
MMLVLMIMTDDQINNEFVDIVMEQLYDVELESQKTFEEAVQYVIPMPPPAIYFISQIPPEQIEELFSDMLRWLRDGYDF